MHEDFEKVIEIYQPSEKDLKEKEDQPGSSDDGYPDLDLLPLAKLCPELGKVIPARSSNTEVPPECC